ncbi:MAG: ABC transporter ATP-binding protein [Chelatococcus sp.]|nr:ABC transporter ATP-binding protein [Chelatococcus sp. HY11]MBX3544887.1 ABC transporter ATP-binding protein [Chelatococcus sp.]CAH1654682.1 murein tripeptide ABC transporter/oligopeptide ABC transporter ATP binding subunit OppD [Hyphomicrobiales bacterium]CAH1685346.1 murein tripeptide ABC transporter/oligopeptide ABC transporter ATP binding subunit OppD [Hyphomicrobiales bacterium]
MPNNQDTQAQRAPLLSVRNLEVSLRHPDRMVQLVRGISFDVVRGEVLGIVGESGAGKSMAGTAITGLLEGALKRTAGEIILNGRRIDTLSSKEMAKVRGAEIGMIFQDPLTSLNPVFTIGRQLMETIIQHTELRGGAAFDEAVSLLQQVGIPAASERMDSYPHEFSGGMRQRVVIALALASRPDLIIADEPTTALDVSIQAQIITLLKNLCRERGTAVILITHDMGVVATTANRVAVMYAGRIVENGPAAEVVANARHPYTRGLMKSIPEIGHRLRRLQQIDGAMPRPDNLPTGCSFWPRCPVAFDRCRSERPELIGSANHTAACWLNAEGAAS